MGNNVPGRTPVSKIRSTPNLGLKSGNNAISQYVPSMGQQDKSIGHQMHNRMKQDETRMKPE